MAWLNRLFRRGETHSQPLRAEPANGLVSFDGATLDRSEGAHVRENIAHPDFERAREWGAAFPSEHQSDAWRAVQRAWVAWLAAQYGGAYRVHESEHALLMSAQTPKLANTALSYLSLTMRRVSRSLGRLALPQPETQVVLLLHDHDDYYRYLSGLYPDDGEFAMSSGVHFSGPAPHFAVNGEDLTSIEATLVHEMTHAYLTHLPIPAWLNEGLAVNMEMTFGRVADARHLLALQKKHRKYWTPENIQEFWCGRSYQRPDEGHELSYDLGRLLVAGMSEDWGRFEAFALAAMVDDAGAAAAAEHLEIDLGEFVRHFLERDDGEWAPDPKHWAISPERWPF